MRPEGVAVAVAATVPPGSAVLHGSTQGQALRRWQRASLQASSSLRRGSNSKEPHYRLAPMQYPPLSSSSSSRSKVHALV